jgi:hypothetical protein
MCAATDKDTKMECYVMENEDETPITPFVSDSKKRVTYFLPALEKLCKKYNISISHEDGEGSFIFSEYDESLMKWLKDGYYKKDEFHIAYKKEY